MIINLAKGRVTKKFHKGKNPSKVSFNVPLGQHVSFYCFSSSFRNCDVIFSLDSISDTSDIPVPTTICSVDRKQVFTIQVTQVPDKDVSIHIWYGKYHNPSSGIENKLCYKVKFDPSIVAKDDSTFTFTLSSSKKWEDGFTYIKDVIYK